jgi:uroporphyrinogen III methyltransferase/synthase
MSQSLEGRTILVTRARPQASVFSAALAELGARIIEIPTIEIIPTESDELETAIHSLNRYDWLFFTSVNGAAIFFEKLDQIDSKYKKTMPEICAIGPATADEVRRFGHPVKLQPRLFQAEGILEEFSELYENDLAGLEILIPRAKIARKILPERLKELGAHVEVLPVYETTLPSESPALLEEALSGDPVDLITFTSSSTVRNFVSIAKNLSLSDYDCAVIGPITADTATELGLRVVLQPAHSTIPDFVKAIEEFLS